MRLAIATLLLLTLIVAGCSSNAETNQEPVPTTQTTECPKGMVNDYYPGVCGSYIDKDQNDICDYSE